ncbi:hypothetical protein HN51_013241 [Arachis hypogaea]
MGSQSAFGMICMLHSVIKTSDSFFGVLLVTIVFILFRVSFVKDKDFQAFFAEGCTLLCIVMAFWRASFEREVKDFACDWLHQSIRDALLEREVRLN